MPKQTRTQESEPQEQPDLEEQGGHDIEELKQILKSVKEKSTESKNWISEKLIRGQFLDVYVSGIGGTLVLWVRTKTKKHGYPMSVDDLIQYRLEDLEDAINQLNALLPVLKEYAVPSQSRTKQKDAPIVLRRKF